MKIRLTPEQVDELSVEDHNLALVFIEKWANNSFESKAMFRPPPELQSWFKTKGKPTPAHCEISNGNYLVLDYPGVFLLESVDLVQAFVKTLTPSELAVFIDDEQVTEWLYACKQDDPQPEFEFWDDGDPDSYIDVFYEYDEYAEAPVLNEYGQAVQNALNALAESKGILLNNTSYGVYPDYYKSIHEALTND